MTPIFTFSAFGYPVGVTGSALLMFALLVYGTGGSVAEVAQKGVFAGVLFFSVLVHELGHAVVMDRLGLRPLGIVLHGYGGFCAQGRSSTPTQSILASAAGPAAGLLWAAASFVVALLLPDSAPIGLVYLVNALVSINLFMNLMNLLPIYPLDGGHILKNLLLIKLRPQQAMNITRWVSLPLGLGLAAWCFLNGIAIMPIFILLMLYQSWNER